MGPRAGLDGCGKSRPTTGIRSPDRPASSESLYRLSNRGPHILMRTNIFHENQTHRRPDGLEVALLTAKVGRQRLRKKDGKNKKGSETRTEGKQKKI